MATTYIKTQQLTVMLGRTVILHDVNFQIQKGERIGILGKNGAGKTTLIETLLGVNNARLQGELVYHDGIEQEMRVVLQDYQYTATFTLQFLYKNYLGLIGLKPEKDLATVFQFYGLAGLENRRYSKLSGGEKQKFKLLMCLELKPRLVFLDEITTSLDYHWRHEIFRILSAYFREHPDCSLVLVSHDYRELQQLTQRQYVVEDHTVKPVDCLQNYFQWEEEVKWDGETPDASGS